MGEPVESSDLRVFFALAEELHFGRTAERVGLTQPRVSQIIRRMESTLGGRLVDRTTRRVALTPLGQRLRDTVAGPYLRMRAALADLETAAHGVGPTMFLGMLSHSGAGGLFLQDIIDAFVAAHPSCAVRRVEVALVDVLGPLRRGNIDAMCMRLPLHQSDLSVGPLLTEEPRVLLVAHDHALAGRTSVTCETLGDYTVADVPFLHNELLADILPLHTPAGRIIRRGARTDNMTEVLAAVASGQIVHPTARSNLVYRPHPDIVGIPISDAPLTRTALITLSSGPSSAAEAFLATARHVLDRTTTRS